MLPIYLHNNLTRKKEQFISIVPGKVGMYTCGPTVYDFQHIGNMRAYITWDILKRFLLSQEYEVTHIMNVTDVGHLTSDADEGEDKLEVARQRERLPAWQIAEKYLGYFNEDLEKVNILAPTRLVHATKLINEQIAFARKLDAKGYLYRTWDGMYFDTSKVPDYGRLGKLDTKGLRRGSRVAFNPEKRNLTDFAVWKFSPTDKQREMEWDSPWGKGFPGWHLECSAISMKYLGETFDIHTGGVDHLTVHHPNEMAQSQALTGKIQARMWLHSNFITFMDKKMSKSAGTFVRISDIVAGRVDALAYRFFVMQTHYRKEIAYSWDAIKAAHRGLRNLYKEVSFFKPPTGACAGLENKFYTALADDLNTAKALDVFQRSIKSDFPTATKLHCVLTMDEVLGLSMRDEWERRSRLPRISLPLLERRNDAREQKQWDVADAIRDKLLDLGVEVQDTKEGQLAALTE